MIQTSPGITISILTHPPYAGGAAAHWDQPVAPEALLAGLTPSGEQTVYAVMDATRRQALRGAMDLDLYEDSLHAAPLFRTGTAQDAAGPWLLDLSGAD
ncbi:MAG: hypothetical protein Q4G26_15315, partial [Paracoccus sp. (in: a-proteobacteria)]|nr:hypothetical protein [Paracoccus sp. (in: a-proteobacteria)]